MEPKYCSLSLQMARPFAYTQGPNVIEFDTFNKPEDFKADFMFNVGS